MKQSASENATLLESLGGAFACESSANARYRAFAEKADGEGWHGVASLLRAAARAEQIHAGNHGRILHMMGGEVDFRVSPVEVKNSCENIRHALAGELFEVDTMYPALVTQAHACGDPVVVRTFTWALHAEKTHARLFEEALDLLELDDEDSWITMARDFYVCPVCGYTSESPHEALMCPGCKCAWKKFEIYR